MNDLDNKENVEYLNKILKSHADFTNPEDEFESVNEFFDNLKKIVSSRSRCAGFKAIHNLLNSIIMKPDNEHSSTSDSIKLLSTILIYLLTYKSNIDSKPYISVFDNIEYLISVEYDPHKQLITDRTIEVILNSVHTAISECVSRLTKLTLTPKIIIVTRKATVTFNANFEMNNYQGVEITNWFCARDIYEKRAPLIKSYLGEKERLACEAFDVIMSDCTSSKWSLVPFLSKLFNYNIRRMARVILYALSINAASDCNSIKIFIGYKKSFEKIGQELTHNQKRIKHFLRMFIIRLLLDSFNGQPEDISEQNYDYFNKLMVEVDSIETYEDIPIPPADKDLLVSLAERKYGYITVESRKKANISKYISERSKLIDKRQTSYARKILTILHRVEIEQKYTAINKSALNVAYYEIENLLVNLLVDGNTQTINSISDNAIDEVTKIIFLMNEVTDSTGWVPLTSIKWNNGHEKYTEEAIKNVLKNALSNVKNHIMDFSYGIRITDAGQAFLQLMPDFEYFAVRFCSSDPKLISDSSLKKENNTFSCVNTIKKVLFHAIKCAYTVIRRAEEDYSAYGDDAETDYERMHASKSIYKETLLSPCVTHPIRIFNQQHNYIEDFYTYVNSLEPNENRFKTQEEKDELLGLIRAELDEYINWKAYFENHYSKFVHLEE